MPSKFSYPLKVVLAWGEAISGNVKLRNWLMKNGYPELGLFCFAIYNKDDARKWLLENGFPHLMALINGAEGNGQAIMWLEKNGFELLKYMALAADNDEDAMKWMMLYSTEEFQLLTQKIQFIKNKIDESNNDVHGFSKE